MKVIYDNEAKILYIYLIPEDKIVPGIAKRTVSIDYGIHLDLDKDDNPVGIEIPLDDYTEEGCEILKKHFDIRKQ